MGCDFNSDGKSVTKGSIFMQGQTTIGMVEPLDEDVPNCSGSFYISGSDLKLKYKDGDGVITVYTIYSNPPGLPGP